MQPVDQRGHAEHLVHGHHAGAADAHHAHAPVGGVHEQLGLGQLHVQLGRLVPGLLAGHDGEERGAVPLEARVVLVAGGLVDLRLAAELGLDREHRQAARLLAAVAAALAHALVDPDALGRLGLLAALARAALLGGALLVVDQHGHALDLRQLLLGRQQLRALAQLGDRRKRHALVAARVLGGDDDAAHALELEPAREVGHRQLALDGLAAGHGDVLVVEQLVGDVHAGGHRRAHGQRAGVVEGAVAEVLDEVAVLGERRHADPLRALAAHLRDAGDLALALGVEQDHRVAADPAAHERALGRLDRRVVRAAGAEERRALGHRQLGGAPGDRVEHRGCARSTESSSRRWPRRAASARAITSASRSTSTGSRRSPASSRLPTMRGASGGAVEQLLELGLDERPLLLHHDDLVEPLRRTRARSGARAARSSRA